MMSLEPSDRPTADEVLSHKWFLKATTKREI